MDFAGFSMPRESVLITKELLLFKNTQETYMEHYLGVPIRTGLFCSPLRIDPNPTCSFFKSSTGDLLMKDFNGKFTGDFVKVVMEKFQVGYQKALYIIANDFGIVQDEEMKVNKAQLKYSGKILEETKPSKIQVEIQDFTETELKWWASFGITLKTLQKYKVFSCKHLFLEDKLIGTSGPRSPMFGYYGGINSKELELWRIYMPTRRKFRFLNNWTKLMIQGSHMLPKTGDVVVITKSMKDVMLFYELGIPALAPTSESTFLTENQLNKLKTRFKKVVLLYDNDLAGFSAMNRIRKRFEIDCIWLPRSKAKDISDFYKKYGEEKTRDLIERGKAILSKEEKREVCETEGEQLRTEDNKGVDWAGISWP